MSLFNDDMDVTPRNEYDAPYAKSNWGYQGAFKDGFNSGFYGGNDSTKDRFDRRDSPGLLNAWDLGKDEGIGASESMTLWDEF